jgi:hypothetical protein
MQHCSNHQYKYAYHKQAQHNTLHHYGLARQCKQRKLFLLRLM